MDCLEQALSAQFHVSGVNCRSVLLFAKSKKSNHGTVFQRNPKWRLLDSGDCAEIEDHSLIRQVARFSGLKVSLVLIEPAHFPRTRTRTNTNPYDTKANAAG